MEVERGDLNYSLDACISIELCNVLFLLDVVSRLPKFRHTTQDFLSVSANNLNLRHKVLVGIFVFTKALPYQIVLL